MVNLSDNTIAKTLLTNNHESSNDKDEQLPTNNEDFEREVESLERGNALALNLIDTTTSSFGVGAKKVYSMDSSTIKVLNKGCGL